MRPTSATLVRLAAVLLGVVGLTACAPRSFRTDAGAALDGPPAEQGRFLDGGASPEGEPEVSDWPRFRAMADGTVVDTETGLIWQQSTVHRASWTLEQAWALCASLELAGVSGWRLPNIDELRGLVVGCSATAAGSSQCPTRSAEPQASSAACGGCTPLGAPTVDGCYLDMAFGRGGGEASAACGRLVASDRFELSGAGEATVQSCSLDFGSAAVLQQPASSAGSEVRCVLRPSS